MNEKEFCKLYSEFNGEEITDINQITLHAFTGEELFEFCNFIFKNISSEKESIATDEVIIEEARILYKQNKRLDAIKRMMITGLGLKDSYDYCNENFK